MCGCGWTSRNSGETSTSDVILPCARASFSMGERLARYCMNSKASSTCFAPLGIITVSTSAMAKYGYGAFSEAGKGATPYSKSSGARF